MYEMLTVLSDGHVQRAASPGPFVFVPSILERKAGASPLPVSHSSTKTGDCVFFLLFFLFKSFVPGARHLGRQRVSSTHHTCIHAFRIKVWRLTVTNSYPCKRSDVLGACPQTRPRLYTPGRYICIWTCLCYIFSQLVPRFS